MFDFDLEIIFPKEMEPKKLKFVLHGTGGHQISSLLKDHSLAEAVALSGFDDIPDHLNHLPHYERLSDCLEQESVDAVSICSARRDQQVDDIICSLESGCHVYAEKPCVTREEDLDRVVETALRCHRVFHEMGSTTLPAHYQAMKEVIERGEIGEIVQIFSQKSYPFSSWRPKDEGIDGGLAMQVGIYHARFIEHIAGQQINSLRIEETSLGNDHMDSQCQRAVSSVATLKNGGVASGISNYLFPMDAQWSGWGYENVRIFGTLGFVESLSGGETLRKLLTGSCVESIEPSSNGTFDGLEYFCKEILRKKSSSSQDLERQLSPTRWVIRSKESRLYGVAELMSI